MLLFINEETYNHFAVHNELGKIEFMSAPVVRGFKKYSHYVGGIEYLRVPDLKTVKAFRKVISKGILKDVPMENTKTFLVSNFPEFFI